MSTVSLGRWGEEVAARHLVRQGWTIHHRNLRVDRSEVDLVAEKEDTLAFVEVKTRTRARFQDPFSAIAPEKQRRLMAAAERWLADNAPLNKPFRFDAIAVTGCPGQAVRVEHLENAWGI